MKTSHLTQRGLVLVRAAALPYAVGLRLAFRTTGNGKLPTSALRHTAEFVRKGRLR